MRLHAATSWRDRGPRTPPDPTLQYADETDLPIIMELIDRDLSEPYSIFTYRYFVQQWPQLCYIALEPGGSVVGVVVCKQVGQRRRLGWEAGAGAGGGWACAWPAC